MSTGGRYLHQQIGWTMLLLVLAVVIILYVAFVTAGATLIGTLALLIPIAVAFLFGSLMVEVDSSHLRIRFGVGLIRRSWPLKDVTSAEAVRNPWYTGWGIRMLPRALVFNVSGFDAVEIVLTNGKRYRIGTDEPQELERAIRARLR